METKQRHGFVSFWLWLLMIANAVFAIIMVKVTPISNMIISLFLALLLPLLNITGSILLLNWKKFGFWLILGAPFYYFLIEISGSVSTIDALTNLGLNLILFPLVLFAILQIKKNDESCWKQLK